MNKELAKELAARVVELTELNQVADNKSLKVYTKTTPERLDKEEYKCIEHDAANLVSRVNRELLSLKVKSLTGEPLCLKDIESLSYLASVGLVQKIKLIDNMFNLTVKNDIKMISANEARQKIEGKLKNSVTEELRKVEQDITKAINDGKNTVYIIGILTMVTVRKLEELGYDVEVCDGIATTIKW